jgi:hypothetical protein
MRMLALSCCLLLSMGCSFIFVRPPPSEPQQLPYFDCVSSSAAPATDITNAVVDGLIVASALDEHQPEFAASATAVGALYAASAIYGFIMTSKCESAKERLAARVHETRAQLVGLLKVQTATPSTSGGCRGDVDCKGERICANAICVNPPAAPPLAAPLRAAPPLSVPPLPAPTLPAPTPAPASVAP